MERRSPTDHSPGGSIASTISREIVQLHAKLYGRGPTKAKTHLGDRFVLCVLEEVFTPAEQTLIGADNAQQVHATRQAFQDAVETDLVAIVEAATGARVRALMSQVHTATDTAMELFMLEDWVGFDDGTDGAGA